MKTLLIRLVIVLVACSSVAEAQNAPFPTAASGQAGAFPNVQPNYSNPTIYHIPHRVYPNRSTVHHAATAAESFARGQAELTRARGQYNRMTAEARVLVADAQQHEIENRQHRINGYYSMRERNRQEQAAKRGPRSTSEQLGRIAAASKPANLSPAELDRATGEIAWPSILQTREYDMFRADVEELAARWVKTQSLGADELEQTQRVTKEMLAQLKTQVREIPSYRYTATRRFVESLGYQLQQPAS